MDSSAYRGARLETPSAAPVSFRPSTPTPLTTTPLGSTPAAQQPARSSRSRHRWWAPAAGVLVALNLGLGGANAYRFGLPPFADATPTNRTMETSAAAGPGDSHAFGPPADAVRYATPAPTIETDTPTAQPAASLAEAVGSTETAASTDRQEAPMRVMAAISMKGELMVAGSVPDDATALRMLETAATHLPGGAEQILGDLSVHPNAPFDAGSTPVLLWEPAIFAEGSSVLDPQYTPILDVGIELLAGSPELKVAVTGHSSPDGSLAPNLFLSAARVSAVLDYLKAAGVPEDQILTIAAGESDPREGDAGRRVEVEITNFFGEG